MSGDVNWSNVSLLLRCNDSNGATAFTDDSSAARAITVVGNAQVTTTDPKYGSGSALFDGSGDRLTAALSAALHLASGEFTIECWVKRAAATSATILSYGNSSFYVWDFSISPGGQPSFNGTNASGGSVTVSAGSVPLNTWTHLAATRSGSTFRLFVNGSQVSSNTSSASMSPSLTGASLSIGAAVAGGSTLNGQLDDIRITAGVARYTANFTPPAAELPVGPPPTSAIVQGRSPLGSGTAVAWSQSARSLGGSPLGKGSVVMQSRNAYAQGGSPLGRGQALAWQQRAQLQGRSTLGSASVLASSRGAVVRGRSPLGSGSVRAVVPQAVNVRGRSPLGSASVVVYSDFTGAISESAELQYVCDLFTPAGTVRVGISSWQATLQTEQANYAQCVVPAILNIVDAVASATEFAVYRRARLKTGGYIEHEMVRSPIENRSFAQGRANYTATLSGYFDAFAGGNNPPAALDRTLTGIRTVTEGDGGLRVRCDVDWLLRPGMRALNGATPILVDFINYYVPGNDQYMDVGERA